MRGSKKYKRAIIRPPAKRHLNGVSLAGLRWPNNRPNIECWLGSFVNFQGIWTSIAKKPYIFVIFQGVQTHCPPPPPPSSGTAHGQYKNKKYYICIIILALVTILFSGSKPFGQFLVENFIRKSSVKLFKIWSSCFMWRCPLK